MFLFIVRRLRLGNKRGPGPGRRLGSSAKAQGSLEITVALICVLTILLGTLNLFLWLNARIVRRQRDYEAGRKESGSGNVLFVDESGYPKLDIFKGWRRW